MGSCRNAKKGRVITLDALDIQRYILRVAVHSTDRLQKQLWSARRFLSGELGHALGEANVRGTEVSFSRGGR